MSQSSSERSSSPAEQVSHDALRLICRHLTLRSWGSTQATSQHYHRHSVETVKRMSDLEFLQFIFDCDEPAASLILKGYQHYLFCRYGIPFSESLKEGDYLKPLLFGIIDIQIPLMQLRQAARGLTPQEAWIDEGARFQIVRQNACFFCPGAVNFDDSHRGAIYALGCFDTLLCIRKQQLQVHEVKHSLECWIPGIAAGTLMSKLIAEKCQTMINESQEQLEQPDLESALQAKL